MTAPTRPAEDWTGDVTRAAVTCRRENLLDMALLKFATASVLARCHSATQRPAMAAILTAFPAPARGSRSSPDQTGTHTKPEHFFIAEKKSPMTGSDYLTKNTFIQGVIIRRAFLRTVFLCAPCGAP